MTHRFRIRAGRTGLVAHALAKAGRLACTTFALMAVLAAAMAGTASAGTPFQPGDVLASVGTGKVKHFKPDGTLIQTLDTTTNANETTGGCFDDSGSYFVTTFGAQKLSKFDSDGDLLDADVGGAFGNSNPESCIIAGDGSIYVGQADGTADVVKLSPSGTVLDTFDVATTARGSDFIDLAADGCTLFYSSENSEIKRYDVCTDTQLADFATGLDRPCFALRIRPNGEVMIACASQVYRLSATGTVLQTYPVPGTSFLFALNLDPDGETFYTGDIDNGLVSRIDIATGAVVKQFDSEPFTSLAGLSIVGEITASDEGPPGDPTCDDGLDNDQDGDVDLADTQCQSIDPPGTDQLVALTSQTNPDRPQRLRFFSASAPAVTVDRTISGVPSNELLVGIDVRPAIGQLYGVTRRLGSRALRLYTIDPATGAATLVGQVSTVLGFGFFGVDFNPVVDRLRIVNTDDRNARVNPAGGPATNDAALKYAAGDPNAGKDPQVAG